MRLVLDDRRAPPCRTTALSPRSGMRLLTFEKPPRQLGLVSVSARDGSTVAVNDAGSGPRLS